jgi:hypothetical protein
MPSLPKLRNASSAALLFAAFALAGVPAVHAADGSVKPADAKATKKAGDGSVKPAATKAADGSVKNAAPKAADGSVKPAAKKDAAAVKLDPAPKNKAGDMATKIAPAAK